jgi:hypothetical protein
MLMVASVDPAYKHFGQQKRHTGCQHYKHLYTRLVSLSLRGIRGIFTPRRCEQAKGRDRPTCSLACTHPVTTNHTRPEGIYTRPPDRPGFGFEVKPA